MDLTDDPIQVQVWGVAPADAVVWIGEERDEVLFRVAQIFDAVPGATVSDDGAVWGIAVSDPWCGGRPCVVDGDRLREAQRRLRDFAREAIAHGVIFVEPRLSTVRVSAGVAPEAAT